ncbi:hypothetical protein NIIDNTM18_28480 [Mycolicibacterium litorale]|uniref:Uncharacterized protein n=1 Tax=Mycolicibacterium litorale TaxID=758802 RepID=A0A6S6PA54_9MYCO|nr:hypothetical protein [Mycolicibacterium litorale]BCI53570.1 hypothetical protein NIIDNTM18_28480 [Mycolicibacterium litorale]
MGNRANIVLVDHDGWQLRYSHWAGCQSYEESPAGQVNRLAELFVTEGLPSPEVSASAVSDAGERPSPAEWARFERACAQVRTAGKAA